LEVPKNNLGASCLVEGKALNNGLTEIRAHTRWSQM